MDTSRLTFGELSYLLGKLSRGRTDPQAIQAAPTLIELGRLRLKCKDESSGESASEFSACVWAACTTMAQRVKELLKAFKHRKAESAGCNADHLHDAQPGPDLDGVFEHCIYRDLSNDRYCANF
jgi:hypothetical protein